MQAILANIIEELKQWRAQGQGGVYLQDKTLAALKCLASARPTASAPTARPAPKTSRPATPKAKVELPDYTPKLIDVADVQAKPPAARKATRQASPSVGQGLPEGVAAIPTPEPFELPEGSKQERWEWLRQKVLHCPVCQAHVKPEMQIVFGVGNLDAELFFCGEAPGADEEAQGEPFVGPAGQKLNGILKAMGFSREQVYIGNILNWRPERNALQERTKPTANRKPVPAEMAFGLPYLKAQLAIVQPKVVVALGATAAQGLLGVDSKLSLRSLRGQWHDCEGLPVRVTYHPSYILRQEKLGPAEAKATKREAWLDMLAVMERLDLPISQKQQNYFK